MRTTIVNIGTIVSGDWRQPLTDGDSVSMIDGRIDSVGLVSERSIRDSDVVIDADGATVCPGLIDSQVHITFGDYTPRQKTVGYLESYLHGGTTTSISASEVHVPGRPSDPEGVKALAVAAHKSFWTYAIVWAVVLHTSFVLWGMIALAQAIGNKPPMFPRRLL
ncbi:hypothetical protein [Marinobacter nauticus]